MLFGHNPEFGDLAHRLSSEIVDMPTSAVAEYNFDTKTWTDIGEVEPAKTVLDYPKSSSDGRRPLSGAGPEAAGRQSRLLARDCEFAAEADSRPLAWQHG